MAPYAPGRGDEKWQRFDGRYGIFGGDLPFFVV
jgi:hypothetical protein